MRRFIMHTFVGSSLLLFGGMARAQVTGEIVPSPTPRFAWAGESEFQSGQTLFHHVRADVDRAQSNMKGEDRDLVPFDQIRSSIIDLQRAWDSNDYRPSQVDNVTSALRELLDKGRLLSSDRDQLASDLNQLREFRANH